MDIKTDQNMEQLILETAERLFLEKGFSATSTTQIAKEVGCNQALVHYYFRTKENLFSTIFEQKFRFFFQTLFRLEAIDSLSFEAKIRYVVESHFDMLVQNPKMPALILNELSRRKDQVVELREKLRELPEKLFSKLNVELQAEIAAGRIREISIIDLLFSALTLNIGMFVMLPVVESVLSLDETQRQLLLAHRRTENVDFILKSLRP